MRAPIEVLFVCLGNICRSPMAEGIFQHLVDSRGLTDRFVVESAGTAAYHVGKRAHPLTLEVLQRNGIELGSRARQVQGSDFERFDVLLAMDRSNLADLRARCPASLQHKLHMLFEDREVPDPYYGGIEGYEKNYELLRPALQGWLDRLLASGS